MSWAITGRICEDVYFWLRHQCFRVVAVIYPSCLPLIREAERQLKQHDEHLRPQYTWIERMGEGWTWPTLVFIFPLLLTIVIAATVDMPLFIHTDAPSQQASTAASAQEQPQREDPGVTLTGHLKTTATVLATLTGLLLAVIALTINVKTSNLAGASFLLNAVIRRRGFLPAAAFLLGTVFTALVGGFLSGRIGLQLLNNWTVVAALLGVACLFVLLMLLRGTMQTLGTSELEHLLSAELLALLRKSLHATLRYALVQTSLCQKLERLGFARCAVTEKQEGHQTEYKLDRLGRVIAIDFAPLERIRRLLKLAPLPAGRNTSSIFVYGPNDPAAYITLQPDGIVTKDTRLVLLTKEHAPDKRIGRLTRRTFIIGRVPEPELPWERVRELIRSATSRRESGTIKAVARALDDIVDDYLETQHAVSGEGSMVLEDTVGRMVYHFTPPDPPELRLSDLAVDAARSDSAECSDQLLTCIYRLAVRAFRRRNVKYFQEWTFEFHTAYHLTGSPRDDAESHVTSGIVERVGWLGQYLLDPYFFSHVKLPEQVKEASAYAVVVLSLCLHVLKTSAERSDQSTFDGVAEHLSQFLKRDLQDNDIKACLDVYRAGDRRNVSQSMPLVYADKRDLLAAWDDIYDYKSLVHVVVGAWLMHEVEGHELQAEKVSYFMERIIASTPGFRELLDLYAMPGMADMATNRENLLMFHTWHSPYSPYSAVRCGTEFQRWIRPFYQFLLLKKAAQSPPSNIDLRDIRETSGADHDSLRAFLAEIASAAYVVPSACQGIPWGMDDGTLALAKTRISELVTSWAGESGKRSSDEAERSVS